MSSQTTTDRSSARPTHALERRFAARRFGRLFVVLAVGLVGLSCNRVDFGPDAGEAASDRPADALIQKAEQGDAAAQFELAAFYAAQEQPEGDLSLAAEWYRRAAEQEHAPAQVALAVLRIQEGGSAQTMEARRWLLKAVEQGDPVAHYHLGELYSGAGGYEPDPVKAVLWWRRAADRKVASAHFRLGEAYESGLGVDRDPDEAIAHYRNAANGGSNVARHRLGQIYDEGELVARDAGEAATWYRAAAEQGHAPAQAQLGFMYARGDGLPQRYDMALEWSQRAAEAGDPAGCNNLAVLHLKGFGVEQDIDEAVRWYRKAAEGSHAAAQNMLGTLFLTGQGGVEQSADEAEHWWRMAADQGYAPAQYNLGGMYSRSLSKSLSREDALLWLGRAAEQGHEAAGRELIALEAGDPTQVPAAPAEDATASSS